MIGTRLFNQADIMEANLHVYARIVERKSHLVNLDIGIWETEILGINRGVKVVDSKMQKKHYTKGIDNIGHNLVEG